MYWLLAAAIVCFILVKSLRAKSDKLKKDANESLRDAEVNRLLQQMKSLEIDTAEALSRDTDREAVAAEARARSKKNFDEETDRLISEYVSKCREDGTRMDREYSDDPRQRERVIQGVDRIVARRAELWDTMMERIRRGY